MESKLIDFRLVWMGPRWESGSRICTSGRCNSPLKLTSSSKVSLPNSGNSRITRILVCRSLQFSLSLIALKALPVLILGGFTSIPGAIVGGLIVGVGEKLFEFLIGAPFLGGATENWFAYMLALVFLVFRPQGLFGEKIIERV